eukprot:5583678-Pleurochrysis_carterae.AAC.1
MQPPSTGARCLAAASVRPPCPSVPPIHALAKGGLWVGRTWLPPARPQAPPPPCARARNTTVSRSPVV